MTSHANLLMPLLPTHAKPRFFFNGRHPTTSGPHCPHLPPTVPYPHPGTTCLCGWVGPSAQRAMAKCNPSPTPCRHTTSHSPTLCWHTTGGSPKLVAGAHGGKVDARPAPARGRWQLGRTQCGCKDSKGRCPRVMELAQK